jgi:hypothetical protein
VGTRWGATLEEWGHWSVTLGLTADLLPVVSNPAALISPDSKLKSLGKTPSRYNAQHQVVGIHEWTGVQATAAQVRQWSVVPDYGICLQNRSVRAIDIDIEDASAVHGIICTIFDALGPLPLRRRADSKRALLVFLCQSDIDRWVLKRDGGLIELRGTGQQCVVAGTHPKGARYEWAGGLPASIPSAAMADVERCWQALGGERPNMRSGRSQAPNGPDVPATQAMLADPVVTWLESRGWVRERQADRLLIECPWSMDHSVDSGATETAYWPAGTGGFEQGHFKCLHAHCEGRSDHEFLVASGYVRADFDVLQHPVLVSGEPVGAASGDVEAVAGGSRKTNGDARGAVCATRDTVVATWSVGPPSATLKKGKKGFQAVLENLTVALDTPGFWWRLGYDNFRQALMRSEWCEAVGAEQWVAVTHDDLIQGRELLGRHGFEAVGRELMRDAVERVARRRQFDGAQVWVGRLRWDAVRRVDSFFETYYGAVPSAYTTAVSRYWWSALAGRVLEPGVQADMVPILIGEEGLRKTRGIESMAPYREAYVTLDLSMKDADLARRMRGRLIWELNELRGLHTSARESVNTFITEGFDSWVPKYEEFAVNSLRRGMFIGSGNDEEILEAGRANRRWLPLMVTRFCELTALVRDQLWAEGAAIFLSEGVAWQAAYELAGGQRAAYTIGDVWQIEIEEWLNGRQGEPRFTLRDAALGIGLDPRQMKKMDEMRLAKVLKVAGAVKFDGWQGGKSVKYWRIRQS